MVIDSGGAFVKSYEYVVTRIKALLQEQGKSYQDEARAINSDFPSVND